MAPKNLSPGLQCMKTDRTYKRKPATVHLHCISHRHDNKYHSCEALVKVNTKIAYWTPIRSDAKHF